MTLFIKRLSAAFTPPQSIPSDPERFKKEVDRRIVRELASGNIRIQSGKFSTQEDIDGEYENIRDFEFTRI